VTVDTHSIADLAMRMHRAGCRRFLCAIDDEGGRVRQIRWEAYRRAVELLDDVPPAELVVIPQRDLRAQRLPPPVRERLACADFVFVPSDPVAIQLTQALIDNGFSVPRDIGVCGYDNTFAGRHMQIPLTSIAYDIMDACAVLVDTLLRILYREAHESIRLVDSWVVLRESTRPVAVDETTAGDKNERPTQRRARKEVSETR
jgi:DNA-binding LacI/PurR family transcriptional regulator